MSNWISHKAQYFKKNGDIDRKKECTCFLLDTINSDLYEVVHAAFYCNVYYAAVVQTKIFNDQEYKESIKRFQRKSRKLQLWSLIQKQKRKNLFI